ncbi:MAG TPA: hypothetical protein VF786_12080 [Terriglobales bacterium]
MKRAAFIAVALLVLIAISSAQSGKGKSTSVAVPDESKIERHYWLLKNGGAIEMVCKAPCDSSTQATIQQYLDALAKSFEKGSFEAEFVTGTTAPVSLANLKKLRDEVTFHAASSDVGYSLRMLTVNPQARDAIYDFMRYEITNRKTGDPTTLD